MRLYYVPPNRKTASRRFPFPLTKTRDGYVEVDALMRWIRGHTVKEDSVMPAFDKHSPQQDNVDAVLRRIASNKPKVSVVERFLEQAHIDVNANMRMVYLPAYTAGRVQDGSHAIYIAVHYCLLRLVYKLLGELVAQLRIKPIPYPGKNVPRMNRQKDVNIQTQLTAPNPYALQENIRRSAMEGLAKNVGELLAILMGLQEELLGSLYFFDVTELVKFEPTVIEMPRYFVKDKHGDFVAFDEKSNKHVEVYEHVAQWTFRKVERPLKPIH